MEDREREAYNRSLQCWRDNCRVVNVWDDPAACKPREECQPFTFELYGPEPLPEGATLAPGSDTRYVHEDGEHFGYRHVADVKAQEKFMTGLARLTKAQARKDAARAKAEAKALKQAA